jgi:hypothetical protein
MQKLKLDPETVDVQSFPTTPQIEALTGTVHAEMRTRTAVCGTCEGTSVCCETV